MSEAELLEATRETRRTIWRGDLEAEHAVVGRLHAQMMERALVLALLVSADGAEAGFMATEARGYFRDAARAYNMAAKAWRDLYLAGPLPHD